MKKYLKIVGIVFLALLLLLFLPIVSYLAQQLFMLAIMMIQLAIAVVMMRLAILVIQVMLGKKKLNLNPYYQKLKMMLKKNDKPKKRMLEKA
jgi:hypothetical protein